MPEWKPRNTTRARQLRNEATPAERALWRHLQGGQVEGHKFSRQMPIGPFSVDFLCRRSKLVIELDGFSHEMRVAADASRTAFLQRSGFAVLRFTNEDVLENAGGVVAAIREALADRPTPGPSRKREGR